MLGIGESIARRIVDYRAENGSFRYPVELMNIDGIGETLYEQIRSMLVITELNEGTGDSA